MPYRRHAGEVRATAGAAGVSLFVAFFGLAAAGTAVSIGVLMLLAAGISIAITVASRRAWPLAIAALDVVAALVFDLAEPTDKVFDMALGYVGLLLAFGVALVATAGVLRSFGHARFALPLESVGAPLALIALAPLLAEHPANGDIPETGPDTPATVLLLLAAGVVGSALIVAVIRRARPLPPITALALAGLALALAPLTLRYAYPHPLRVATTFRGATVAAAIAGTWLWIAGRGVSPRPIRWSTLVLVIATVELLTAVVLTQRDTRRARASQTVRFQVAPIPPPALRGAYLPLTYVDQAVERGAGDVAVGDEVQVVLERSGRLLWEPTRLAGSDDFEAVRIRAVVTGVGNQVTVRFPDIDRAPLPSRPADGSAPPVAVIVVEGDATARIVHLEVARRPGRGWPQAAPTGTAASVNPSYPAAATVSQVPR